MGRLTATPSSGHSEVLDTLHYEGAISAGVQIFRLEAMVAHRWMSDEDREGADATFSADLLTVLAALQGAGYVVGHADRSSAIVDLSATPPPSTWVTLTGAGRVQARAPRPRARRIIG